MSTVVIAYLAASAVFILVLAAGNRMSGGMLRNPSDVSACNQRLSEIDKKIRAGELSEDDAAKARVEIVKGLIGNNDGGSGAYLPFRRAPLAAATLFSVATSMLVAHFAGAPTRAETDGKEPNAQLSGGGAQDEAFARLRDFALSKPSALPSSMSGPMSRPIESDGPSLPDVNTMLERLANRLEKEPGDADGWRMLGWSYFHTDRFDEAEKAYVRALALSPESDEIKAGLKEVRAKLELGSSGAADTAGLKAGPNASPISSSSPSPTVADIANAEALPAGERDAMVRTMVDRLAIRLEASPRDAEGWIRLMRSRTVLGEKAAAAAALRKALEVFKDEPERMTEIAAAARELGVTSE